MTNSTTVTINGVEYEFSKPNYDILQVLISGARVIEEVKTASPAAAAKPAVTTTAIIREQVKQSALLRAMGIHYTECAIYDNENNKLLTQTYNGKSVLWDAEDTKNAQIFKEWFDKEFKKENLTLVCSVSKQVSKIDCPDWGKWTKSEQIRMNTKGSYTVCNFIVRNETTGKLEMFNDAAWLGVWCHVFPRRAARHGAYRVASLGAESSGFRNSIIAGYQRNKAAGR